MWSSGNGSFCGQKAFRAKCKRTVEILADGIEENRLAELRRRLPENVNGLGFEEIQMGGIDGHYAAAFLFGRLCKPHSRPQSLSHHHRPARMSSPGWIARVQGAQPIEGESFRMQGIHGYGVLLDIGFQLIEGPIGNRVELDKLVLLVPCRERHIGPAVRLSAPKPREPAGRALKPPFQRLDFPDMAASLPRFDRGAEAEHAVARDKRLHLLCFRLEHAESSRHSAARFRRWYRWSP